MATVPPPDSIPETPPSSPGELPPEMPGPTPNEDVPDQGDPVQH